MTELREEIIEKASAITHAHPRSVLGCKIYTEILFSVINHPDKESIKLALGRAMKKYKSFNEFPCYERIFSPDFERAIQIHVRAQKQGLKALHLSTV